MKEYKTIHGEFVHADDLDEEIKGIDEEISELMKFGWIPHGQVQFIEDWDSNPKVDAHIMIVQTMVR